MSNAEFVYVSCRGIDPFERIDCFVEAKIMVLAVDAMAYQAL